ncbi:MAG: hypothetical protein QOE47_2737 [Pyrinomonadaceae bacterium]|jgi:hypothetical protein|nr:hypothetical protein [Pyrinomonadaceae bacterium]
MRLKGFGENSIKLLSRGAGTLNSHVLPVKYYFLPTFELQSTVNYCARRKYMMNCNIAHPNRNISRR